MAKPNQKSVEKVVKKKIENTKSRATMANAIGSKKLDGQKPCSGKQRLRGLGKAGAKRLGQMLRKAIQQKEGVKGNGNKPLPKTPVGLLKQQADEMAKATSNEKQRVVPRVSDLILQVIAQCKTQGGISMVELKKALAAGGYDVSKNNSQVNKAVRGLVRTETLVQTSGKGRESYWFNTKKLTDEKRIRTRAARKKAIGNVMAESPAFQPSTGTESPTQASTTPARRGDIPSSMTGPSEKSVKPVTNAKPRAKASPARRVKKSPKKRNGKAKTNATRRNRKLIK